MCILSNSFHHLVGAWPQFSSATAITKWQGVLPHQGIMYMGLGKNCDFDWNLHISRKLYDVGPWLLWITSRKSIDPCRFQWPWVTVKGVTQGVNFWWIFIINYICMVWPRVSDFGMGTQVVNNASSQGIGAPVSTIFLAPLPKPTQFNLERRNLVW